MSDFTETLTKIEAIKNTHERVDVSNFYVSNHLRENDCCIPSEDWEMILYYDFDPWCLIEDITEHWTPELKRKVAKIWWKEFEYIEKVFAHHNLSISSRVKPVILLISVIS